MHTTMHSQNTGGRKERQLQIFGVLQLGTQVVPLINFIFNCNLRLLINITTGQTSYEYPYFGYADRCVQWWPNRRTKPSLEALQSEKFLNHSLRCQRTIKTKLLNLWSRHSFLIASSIISNSDDLKRLSKNQCTQQCIAKIQAEGS